MLCFPARRSRCETSGSCPAGLFCHYRRAACVKGLGCRALNTLLFEHYQGNPIFLEIESAHRRKRITKHSGGCAKQFYLKNKMTELGLYANVFGTEMELLSLSDPSYLRRIYQCLSGCLRIRKRQPVSKTALINRFPIFPPCTHIIAERSCFDIASPSACISCSSTGPNSRSDEGKAFKSKHHCHLFFPFQIGSPELPM